MLQYECFEDPQKTHVCITVFTISSTPKVNIFRTNVDNLDNEDVPCTKTDQHLKLPIFANISRCAVDSTHKTTEVTHSALPVFIWIHLPLLCTFKVDLGFFCQSNWNKNKMLLFFIINLVFIEFDFKGHKISAFRLSPIRRS